jgi:Glycosyl hydrolases family 16
LSASFSDDFDGAEPGAYWTRTLLGGGTLACTDSTLRLAIPALRAAQYGDAQIDDYGRLPRAHFRWRPPLRMEVRARTSHPQQVPGQADPCAPLRGTAGFGFWNYPFTPTGGVRTLPDAVWFFYASQPSDMALVPGVPGHGWKAQVVHAHRPGALAALTPTLGAIVWGRVSGARGPAERWVQRLSGAREAHIDAPMTAWHDYTLEWQPDRARFWVDGTEVLAAASPPRGPLGFVAWVDNQYAVATPRGVLRFGALPAEAEWIELARVRVTPLG